MNRMTAAVAAAAALAVSQPAAAQSTHDHGAPQQTAPAPSSAPAPAVHEHMGHMQMGQMEMDHEAISGALGAPSMNREASGTSWQPDASMHGGVHAMRGDWMLMGHALFNAVYDWQDGPRGEEKAFVAGMLMGSARRDFADGTLNLRAMLSPDPAMGAEGYPLLFAAGETADGVDTLVDRQHPHDLFMELSASYAHRIGENDAAFVYAGLPGEPAFGPPTFMHRLSAMDFPEAPISHHWFDSTHITYGVLTAGWVHGDWKLDASRFRGREPDEDRWDIESGALDSSAARLSWNPDENWSLQVSWADIASPEALHPDEDETRWSASAIRTVELGVGGWWSTTLGVSNKARGDGVSLNAWLAETALHPNEAWTFYARGERIETDELGGHGGPVRAFARLSAGAIRDWRLSEHTLLGLGVLAQHHFTPNALEGAYGGDPNGAMGFVRLKVG